MKTTEEMIEVMQAYADGKKIESTVNGYNKWSDCDYPTWEWVAFDFRVKKEPTYRPYESVDEMLDDFCKRCRKHGMTVSRSPMGEPFIWLLSKDSKTIRLATAYDKEQGCIRIFGGCLSTLQDIFENYTYKDGSPCGKKVEE